MNRPLKFRAWTGKEWFYQDDQYLGSFIRRAVAKICADSGRPIMEHESYLPTGGDIGEYLFQFCGFTDVNGVDIYEGDRCEVRGGWPGAYAQKTFVQEMYNLDNFHFWEEVRLNVEAGGAYKVISNIREHPKS